MEQSKVWDEIAVHWNDFRTKLPPTVEKFLDGKSGKILDVGCGSGRNFVDNDLEWSGVDFSSEMIKLAEGKGYSELKVGSAEDLPFEDSSFDYVLCYAVLHCVETPEKRKKVLEEIYRVLKPNGEAMISSWGPKSPRLKNKGKECFVSWGIREGESKVERYTYVFDLDELVDLAESVGFEVLQKFEERNVNLIVRKNQST